MANKTLTELAVLLESGQYDQAIALTEKISRTEAELETMSISAHYLNTAGLTKQASELTDKILALEPDFIPSLITKGSLARARKDFAQAQKCYEHVLKIDEKCISAHYNLAVLHEHKLAFKLAISSYEATVAIDSNHLKARARIGACQQKLNLHEQAIVTFYELIKLLPESATIKYQLGLSLQQTARLPEALEQFEAALLLEANHTEAQHGLATVYAAQKQYDLAISAFIQVLKLKPQHAEALHNLASIYYHKQAYKKALDCWLKLLSSTPDQYTKYNIGSCYLALQRHDEAKPYLKSACLDLPQSTDPIINLASIYIKAANWPKVVALYQHALTINPESPEIKYVLAAIQQSNNNFTKAPADYVTHLFDHYADSFEQHLVENLDYKAHIIIAEQLFSHIDLTKKYNVLDLGCGTGLCGTACKKIAKKLVGVDLSSRMLEEAKKLEIFDELEQAEIEGYLARNNNFDIVMAADVMPYIGDLVKTLDLIWLALNAGGFCIFTIEISTKNELYSLSESGRYQHNPDCLSSIILKKWQIINAEQVVTRTQNFNPVKSTLFLLQKEI